MRNANNFGILATDSFRNQNNALNSDLASTIAAISDIVLDLREYLKISNNIESSDSDQSGTELVGNKKKGLPLVPSARLARGPLPAFPSLSGELESKAKEREGPQVPSGQCGPLLPSEDDDTSTNDAAAALIAKYAHLDQTCAPAMDSEEANKSKVPAVDLLAMMALLKHNTDKLEVSVEGIS
jgi:hypothetical protein